MEKKKPSEGPGSRAGRGAAGDACPRGRCDLPFHRDGDGGMHEGHVS